MATPEASMDRTRWVGVAVLVAIVGMLGAMTTVVAGREDSMARGVSSTPQVAEADTSEPVSAERQRPAPAPTWTGEEDPAADPQDVAGGTEEVPDPASDGGQAGLGGEEEGGEGSDTTGPEPMSPPQPVPVEPPAAGEGGEYTEEEYRAIYEEHNRRVGLISTRPDFDPNELALYWSSNCPCWTPYFDDFFALSAAGQYDEGSPAIVLAFELERVHPDGSFTAHVIDQRRAGRTLDAAGNTVAE